MAETVAFVVDPICPWTYVTSKWIRILERRGLIDLTWRVFSLELANSGTSEAEIKGHARSELSLRTLVTVRQERGEAAAGQFYGHVGRRFHEEGQELEDPSTIEGALQDAQLPTGIVSKASSDASTWNVVAAEHAGLVEDSRSFGVPTIVLDDDPSLSMFGPILSEVPDEECSVELWGHVSWLIRRGEFAELKRDRRGLDLWSYDHFLQRIAESRASEGAPAAVTPEDDSCKLPGY